MKKKIIKNKLIQESLIIIVLIIGFIVAFSYYIANNSLAVLSNNAPIWGGNISSSFKKGNGSINNPYQIASGDDLAYLGYVFENEYSSYANKYFVLSSDINMNNLSFPSIAYFDGNLDGKGHTIGNIDIISKEIDNVYYEGLFAKVENATISNLNLQDMRFSNSQSTYLGSLSGVANDSTFNNISIIASNINSSLNNNSFLGGLVGYSDSNHYNNIYIRNTITTTSTSLGSVIGFGLNDSYNYVLVNSNNNTPISNTTSANIYYTSGNNFTNGTTSYSNQDILNTFSNNNYTWLSNAGGLYLTLNEEDETEAPYLENITFNVHDTGIDGNTVYLNDLASTYYDFLGQNYTYSSNLTVPTMDNKNINNSNNLVRVQLTYHGTDINNNYTGTVSNTETQNKFVYYKYYKIVNGQIDITLIDNPFSNRPTDKVFNGWITDYPNATITLDNTYYERHLIIPVNNTNDIVVNIYASWTTGSIAFLGNGTFTTALGNLQNAGLHQITTSENIYGYVVDGYYTRSQLTTTVTVGPRPNLNVTFNRGTCDDCYVVSGNYNNYTATHYDHYTCPDPTYNANRPNTATNTCNVYYLLDENDTYNQNTTYYAFTTNRGMTATNIPQSVIGVNYFYNNTDIMAGYYKAVTIPRYSSITGYYNNNGVMQNGTCNTAAGCSLYEYLNYDVNNIPYFEENSNYYYLTTRDTNIIVLNNNSANNFVNNTNKPFTFTGLHNNTLYNATWNVTDLPVVAYANVRIENMTIRTGSGSANTNPPTNLSTRTTFYGNAKNVKIGRGILRYNNYRNFLSVVGSTNSATGSNGNATKYKLEIESGYYNSIAATNGAATGTSSGTYYLETKVVYGNDYDRASNNNNNLDVYFCASGTWKGNLHSDNDTDYVIMLTVKSGQFGSSRYDLTTGIYVGGRYGGIIYAPSYILVEGGWIYNLIGGPLISDSIEDKNMIDMHMTGGQVDVIIGGAGTTTTYGNRIIAVTGGIVNFSVFGGSNGYDGGNGDGEISADTYVYIGGNALIGNDDYTRAAPFGIEKGSVFGSGNGNTNYDSIGSVYNSHIIVADEATVKTNVYGGGNFGALGYTVPETLGADNTYIGNTTASIDIIGGVIEGSVFGAGNNNGSGASYTTTAGSYWNPTTYTHNMISNTYINQYGGLIKGNIYGGANVRGVNFGNVYINSYGGEVNSVYGGGYGGYSNANNPGTYIAHNVNINIGNNSYSTSPLIKGNVYGGGALGSVNTDSQTSTGTNYHTNVVVNKGTIEGSAFGGGEGNNTYTPIVAGDVSVTINGGSVGRVFGANDAAGSPLKTITVNINNGTVGSAFAGGNRAGAPSPDIYVNGGVVTNVFGGSNETGTVNDSYVEINNGTVSNVYGGNNAGGATTTSYVHINNSASNVYGGNNLGGTNTTSYVYLNDGTVLNAFGGGNQAETTTSNIYMDGVNITNLYGGGNLAEVTTTNVYVNSGVSANTFGGGNRAEVETSNILVDGATTTNLYGAGNEAGASETNVNLLKGTVVNTYGGANQNGNVSESHIITGNISSGPTITCPNLNATNIYGGNNMGGTTTDTFVDINCGTISNIYGGGNEAITSGNTNVFITDATINSSVYGGGNRASVLGNATTNIDGNTIIQGSLFGGGNNGAIGTIGNESVSTVNLVGGSVYGNVYGGCNTSVVYGTTDTNIGNNASNVSGLKINDIYVEGTVFGGGEANASGSEDYDYSFISVTVGIDVLIDGTNYLSNGYDFATHGSIFGSGNASSSSGYSYVTIKNLGTRTNPNENVSIQRADIVTIDNSVIELTGATDRTNEYSNIKYSFNQIKDLKIKNNSVILLQQNANRLETFRSLVDINNVEQKAVVTLDENGDVISQNVDNRIYLLANRNLNIATNEAATSYGQVSGMTFMGMYTKYNNNSYMYGLYDPSFSNGDSADAGDIVIGGSYILGLHHTNHDITVDGYYTNIINDEYTEITTTYIDPTPKDTNFYRWIIGSAATNYEFTLTASKYSSLGTYELSLRDFTEGDTLFYVQGFNSEGLTSGITLVDSNAVPKISASEAEANSIIGLAMKSETTEWANYGTTKFLSANNGTFTGTTVYQTDSQTTAPSLMFYLYHAKNITIDSDLGTVIISLLAYTPTNEIEGETSLITVTVNIVAQNFNDSDAYDASISYGKKYEMPSATNVNITNKSQLTTYFSLISFADNLTDFYGNGNSYHHALTSNIVYPVGTKITMLDYGANAENPNVYYYIVDNTNYATSLTYYNQNNEAAYYLSDFIKMDSVSANNTYSDPLNNQLYYDSNIGLVFEEFIFIIDFENTDISGNLLENTVLLELRNADDFAIVSVLGIRQSLMKYSLYESSNIQLEEIVDYDEEYIYNNTDYIVDYEAIVAYDQTANLQSVIDTNYEANSMGLNIYLYDSSNTQVSSSLLEDTTIIINNVVYHADANGVFRIKLADKVANLSRTVNIHIGNVLAPDQYTLYFKLFASNDGLYSDGIKETIYDSTSTLLDRENAFSVELSKEETILYKEDLDNNQLNIDINYMSVLNKPNIRITLYKRNTTTDADIEYTEVLITNYFTGTFLNPNYFMYTNQTPYEKMVVNNPNQSVNAIYTLNNDIPTGTYKLSFILYNQNDEIERIDKYFIIKTKM